MRRYLSRCGLLIVAGMACRPALAQEQPQPRFEIAPFAGLRGGGDFDLDDDTRNASLDSSGSVALALNLRIDEVSQYELLYARQSTQLEHDALAGRIDVDVEYLHLGGTVSLEGARRVIPYGGGGLGVTRFQADSPSARDDARFSISLGAGIRVPVRERFSLRFEGRGYLTFVDADAAFFCRSNEDGALCRVRGNGSTFFQYELLAGAAFAF
jgi:opacity protein-like surface antigen